MGAQHNPTPWQTEDAMILDADGKIIGNAGGDDTGGREDSDNAAFIVRACNAHDDLTDRLRAVRDFIHQRRVLSGVELVEFHRLLGA